MAGKLTARLAPGDRLEEGIVARVTDAGVMVALEAHPGEVCPDHSVEMMAGDVRVFLPKGQAPIPAFALHPVK